MSDPAATEQLATTITRPRPGAAVLAVHGEIDTLTAPCLETAVAELMSGDERTLVVDMAGVGFMASSGLAVLIAAAQQATERGTHLRLVVTTRAVRRPLEITGTDRLFVLHDDVADATRRRD